MRATNVATIFMCLGMVNAFSTPPPSKSYKIVKNIYAPILASILYVGTSVFAMDDATLTDIVATSKASDVVAISKASNAKITAKVSLDFSIARGTPEKVEIGIFGNDAPAASKFFLSVCQGQSGLGGLSYDGAQVSQIIKDEFIAVNKFALGLDKKQETIRNSVGVVRMRSKDLAEDVVFDDKNDLTHDVPGIISMKKGGGNFGFTISPGPNEDLDDNNVVIGRVLSGLDVINKLNEVPVSKEDGLGSKGGFIALGKNGGDGRAKIAQLGKPLQKIRINTCDVEERASIASMMKF